LREIEHAYADAVVAIGVHSGKYIAERDTGRIQDASLRLDTPHPVVNDRQFRVWRSYAVRAWPTLVVIDPAGYVVGMQAGEFTSDALAPYLDQILAASDAAGATRRGALDFPVGAPSVRPGTLRYPGKVALDPADPRRIAVADTGHHRVLVGTLSDDGGRMRVQYIAGDGTRGFDDGMPGRLAAPQGMAFDGDVLFVADAENHAVRILDLASGALRTLAGTGRRVRTQAERRAGALASPWDVAVGDGTLYVAMAGTHQLYTIDLATGRPQPFAGSGGEDIRDGPRESALLAQPMGLAHDGERLYFVDAESSAVRWADLGPDGAVHTIVGTGLFDFGDKDGVGDAVRMQHQQGIAVHPSGRVLAADSYNDALKWVDPATRRAETWLRGFHEPGGVAVGGRRVYVADTNAHRLVVVEESGERREVEIDETSAAAGE